MSETGAVFLLETLFSYMDIDAFNARKNAESRAAYFGILKRFVDSSAQTAHKLVALSKKADAGELIHFIDNLQGDLIEIGATSLVWDAEKVALLAREGERTKCAEESIAFANGLEALAKKIAAARTSSVSLSGKKPLLSESPRGTSGRRKDKPKTAAKLTPLEKLFMLLENHEREAAFESLEELLKYSYTSELDALLDTARSGFASSDHELAAKQIERAIAIVLAAEKDNGGEVKPRILTIDDVPDVLNTVKSVLSDRYHVYGVTNHKAALKFLMGNAADLVLLDIEMPEMDGFSLLSVIRKTKNFHKTPVLFLTGSVSVENVKKSFASGGNDFIRKPINASVLLSKVEKHLEKA